MKINLWQKKNELKGAPDWLRVDLQMQEVTDPNCIVNYMKNPQLAGGDMVKEFKIIEDKGDE